MIKLKSIVTLISCTVIAATVLGDVDPEFSYETPEYIKSISTAKALRQYVYSQNTLDRITACIRLGEIGGEASIQILIEAFNKEPHGSAAEAVKFHALLSIGKIGGARAEKFLTEIAMNYSENINNSTQAFGIKDSLAALRGSFQGLYEIGSSSTIAALDSIFKNQNYYWFVRSLANLQLLKHELRNDSIRTASDSALSLMARLRNLGGPYKQFNPNGKINEGFMVQNNIFYLIYQYRNITLPYLKEFIVELDINDPGIPSLEKLKDDMESNPLK